MSESISGPDRVHPEVSLAAQYILRTRFDGYYQPYWIMPRACSITKQICSEAIPTLEEMLQPAHEYQVSRYLLALGEYLPDTLDQKDLEVAAGRIAKMSPPPCGVLSATALIEDIEEFDAFPQPDHILCVWNARAMELRDRLERARRIVSAQHPSQQELLDAYEERMYGIARQIAIEKRVSIYTCDSAHDISMRLRDADKLAANGQDSLVDRTSQGPELAGGMAADASGRD
jgi:hypothetical protein